MDNCECCDAASEHVVTHSKKLDKKILNREILAIAWPSIIELILVTVCQMADMIMVGRLGAYAIAAVGITNQPRFLMLSAFIALNVGTTALVARLKGEGKQEEANKVLYQSMILTIFLSIAISILGIIFAHDMVILMGGEEDVAKVGGSYFKIIMSGFIFTCIPLCITAALRGAGNTKASMYLNVIANVVNIIFNYLLIYGKLGFPRLEVDGAAIATVIGYIVSFVISLYILFRRRQYLYLPPIKSMARYFKPDFKAIKRIIRIGLPSAGEQMALRLGLLIYTRIVAGLGTVAFATHQIGLNILSLSFMNGQAFGIAATTLIGQSLGEKDIEKAKAYADQTRHMGAVVAFFIAGIFFFLGKQLVWLFNPDPDIMKAGNTVLKIVAIIQPSQASFQILAGGLRGAGDTKWPALSILVGVLIIRPILAFILVNWANWGLIGAWIALAADQFIRSVLIYIRFRSGRWTRIKV